MRRKPYTQIGIRRLNCYRCALRGIQRKACYQWNICADGVYRPVCPECDIELNELVLRWVGDPEVEAKMSAYRTFVLG